MSNIYSDEYRKIVNKLRQARIETGLTQEEVAKKFGKPQSFISKSESGERRVDVTEIKKFSEIYKKNISYFME
jgi:transcriptional regulator with XRE-family HTH domain